MSDRVSRIADLIEDDAHLVGLFHVVESEWRRRRAAKAVALAKERADGGAFSFTVTMKERPSDRAVAILEYYTARRPTHGSEFNDRFPWPEGEKDPDLGMLQEYGCFDMHAGLSCSLSDVGFALLAACKQEDMQGGNARLDQTDLIEPVETPFLKAIENGKIAPTRRSASLGTVINDPNRGRG